MMDGVRKSFVIVLLGPQFVNPSRTKSNNIISATRSEIYIILKYFDIPEHRLFTVTNNTTKAENTADMTTTAINPVYTCSAGIT